MQRKIAAFFAFNAYSFSILIAFYQALPERFRLNLRSPLSPFLPSDPYYHGPHWDVRYLSFLLLSLMATVSAGVLTGAIAKNRGGMVAVKSAIPLTILWIEIFFVSLFTGTIGSGVVSLIAIPLTILISSYSGNWGERVQRERFPETTVFGIYPYHFIWIVIPLFAYSAMTASWLPYLESVLFHNWIGRSFSETLLHFLSLIYILSPFLGLSALIYLVYKILNGSVLKIRSEWGRALFTIGLLVVVPIVLYRVLLIVGRLMRLIPLEGI